jgi:metallo-beta-lactamase class B
MLRHSALMALIVSALLACPDIASTQPPPARVTPRNDLAVIAAEPFKIFDNLYFVGIGEVGSYVIETSAGLILIDTLWDLDGYTDYLLNQIRKVGLDPADIEYVLILQGHRDHFGGARDLQAVIDARFGTAAADRQMMQNSFGEHAPRIDFVIENGDTITLGDTTIHLEVTPGHTPGTTSLRFPVYDNGTEYQAYFHGGPSVRSEDPAVIRAFIADLERIKRIANIDVQIGGHYDSYLPGTGDLFDRAARLAKRRPGEPHPWVDREQFQAFLEERIARTQEQLAAVQ